MVKIEIPENIYNEIKSTVESTDEFESVEDYIRFVLEEVLKEDEELEEEALSEEDEEKVKERLRGLGYL